MRTKIVDAGRVPEDEQIARAVTRLDAGVAGVAAGLRIGIANLAGCVYRVVELDSMVEAIRLFAVLRGLGFGCRGRQLVEGMVVHRVFVPMQA